MKVTKEDLINEIKVLKKASKIHARYSISQYKKVLKLLEELEREKKSLEKKVEERTKELKFEIKENIRLYEKLRDLALYDPLTKLLNRRAFNEELNRLKEEDFAIMFLDLDGFKQVNDVYGHKIGDELLKIIAKRIKNSLRSEDIVGRIGGDEFVIIIKGKKEKKELEFIAKKLIQKISSPVVINNIKVKVGVSIGIYVHESKEPLQKILSFADKAMYEAKKRGKGIFIFFSDILDKQTVFNEIGKNFEKIKIDLLPIFRGNEIFAYEMVVKYKNFSLDDLLNILSEDLAILENFMFFLFKNTKENTIVPFHFSLLNENFIKKIKNMNISKICISLSIEDIQKIKEKYLYEINKMGLKIVLKDFEKSHCALEYLKFPISCVILNKKKFDDKEKIIFEGFLGILKDLGIELLIRCEKNLCVKD